MPRSLNCGKSSLAILGVRWVVRGLAIDQLFGELHHLRVCLDLGYVIENLLGVVDVALLVERMRNKAAIG